MKPAPFELAAAETVAEAIRLLAAPEARPLAGGQSLGPMLNLRLAQPRLLVRLAGIAQLSAVQDAAGHVTLGACVTHAAIADGRTPDLGDRILARVADGIAYRAVRNRGTIGGSLCHADPAADWPTVLTALDATALVAGAGGTRAVPLGRFLLGAFRTALGPGELLVGIRIPRPSAAARWGYVKLCRKPGEFAHAMAAVLVDPARGIRRAAIGATGGAPLRLDGAAAGADGAAAVLAEPDAVTRQLHLVTLARALAQAGA